MKKVFILIPVLSFVVFAVLIIIVDDTVSSSFKNYDEMVASGIFEAGWLPSYLPKSAINIEEKHAIDTNFIKATFNYKPEDSQSVKSNCIVKETLENGSLFTCEYRGNAVEIKLWNSGAAEYFSMPK